MSITPINESPDEVLHAYLSYLTIAELHEVRPVCKRWKCAVDTHRRWRDLSFRYGMPQYSADHLGNWEVNRINVCRLLMQIPRAELDYPELIQKSFNRILKGASPYNWLFAETLLNQARLVDFNRNKYLLLRSRGEIPPFIEMRMQNENLNLLLCEMIPRLDYPMVLNCLKRIHFLKAETLYDITTHPQCVKAYPEIKKILIKMIEEKCVSLRFRRTLDTAIENKWDDEFLSALIDAGAYFNNRTCEHAQQCLPPSSRVHTALALRDRTPKEHYKIVPTFETQSLEDNYPKDTLNNDNLTNDEYKYYRRFFWGEFVDMIQKKNNSDKLLQTIRLCPNILKYDPKDYSDGLALGRVPEELQFELDDMIRNKSLCAILSNLRKTDQAVQLLQDIHTIRTEVLEIAANMYKNGWLSDELLALIKAKAPNASHYLLEQEIYRHRKDSYLKFIIQCGVPISSEAVEWVLDSKTQLTQILANKDLIICKEMLVLLLTVDDLQYKDEAYRRLKTSHILRDAIKSLLIEEYADPSEIFPEFLEKIYQYQYLDNATRENLQTSLDETIMRFAQEQYTAGNLDEATYNICLNKYMDN